MPVNSCPSGYFLLEQEYLFYEKSIKFYIVFPTNILIHFTNVH